MSEFIFCEGCGARLQLGDRTCPKCGRPAPGILSSTDAASDLAAGKTASFPRISQHLINTEPVDLSEVNVPDIESVPDPFSTSVLPPFDESLLDEEPAEEGEPEAEAEGDTEVDEEAAQEAAKSEKKARKAMEKARRKAERRGEDDGEKKPFPKWLIVLLVLAVLAVGGAWFVITDPFNLMPGFMTELDKAASEEFPSRQEPLDGGSASTSDSTDDGSDDVASISDEKVYSDDELYDVLTDEYNKVVALNSDGDFNAILSDFNGGYLDKNADRESLAKTASAFRDRVALVQDEIDAIRIEDGSAYTDDLANIKQLASWMYDRIDAICQSWDESLKYSTYNDLNAHEDEILEPLRTDEYNTAYNQFLAKMGNWKPRQK